MDISDVMQQHCANCVECTELSFCSVAAQILKDMWGPIPSFPQPMQVEPTV